MRRKAIKKTIVELVFGSAFVVLLGVGLWNLLSSPRRERGTAAQGGCRILYEVPRRGVFSKSVDGSKEDLIIKNVEVHYICYSPVRRRIAYSTLALDFLSTLGVNRSLEIYTADPDGSNVQRLTKDGYSDFYPDWSPDGRKIAFVSGPPAKDLSHVYTIGFDGKEKRS